MNFTALIGPVLGIVASTSTAIALEKAVSIVTPIGIKAVPAFGIKMGVAIAGGVIGSKLGTLVQEQIESVRETVLSTGQVTDETVQEDN